MPNIAAYTYHDVHVWSALLTCLRPPPHMDDNDWMECIEE